MLPGIIRVHSCYSWLNFSLCRANFFFSPAVALAKEDLHTISKMDIRAKKKLDELGIKANVQVNYDDFVCSIIN